MVLFLLRIYLFVCEIESVNCKNCVKIRADLGR